MRKSTWRFYIKTYVAPPADPGVLDISFKRGRRNFIADYDLTPPPGRPHLSKSGPPVERRPFCEVKTFCGSPPPGTHISTLDGARGQVADFSRFGAHLPTWALEQV